MAVVVAPLASGSPGNATLVAIGRTRLLVDAGLSSRGVTERLEAIGVDPSSLACILLSHEHDDHARGARRFSLRHRVPVACTSETLAALDLSHRSVASWQPLESGRSLTVGDARITPFPVPHDAVRPLGFLLEGEGVRVAIATDLGCPTSLVMDRMGACDLLVLESNHDETMLRDGPYPWPLKQRIAGRLGHLSNEQAAALVRRAAEGGCRAVVLAHLSERNNTPELARASAMRALAGARSRVELRIASCRRPTRPVVL